MAIIDQLEQQLHELAELEQILRTAETDAELVMQGEQSHLIPTILMLQLATSQVRERLSYIDITYNTAVIPESAIPLIEHLGRIDRRLTELNSQANYDVLARRMQLLQQLNAPRIEREQRLFPQAQVRRDERYQALRQEISALNLAAASATPAASTSVPNGRTSPPKYDSSNGIRSTKQQELLTTLQTSLRELQHNFPDPIYIFDPRTFDRVSIKDMNLNAKMGLLVATLLGHVSEFKLNSPRNSDADYLRFKQLVNQDLHGELASELEKKNSIFFPIHYAIVSLFRAFFRIFDVLLSLGAKQTKNDTPGYKPFFKLPQASPSKYMVTLSKQFDDAIKALDELQEPVAGVKPTGNN